MLRASCSTKHEVSRNRYMRSFKSMLTGHLADSMSRLVTNNSDDLSLTKHMPCMRTELMSLLGPCMRDVANQNHSKAWAHLIVDSKEDFDAAAAEAAKLADAGELDVDQFSPKAAAAVECDGEACGHDVWQDDEEDSMAQEEEAQQDVAVHGTPDVDQDAVWPVVPHEEEPEKHAPAHEKHNAEQGSAWPVGGSKTDISKWLALRLVYGRASAKDVAAASSSSKASAS